MIQFLLFVFIGIHSVSASCEYADDKTYETGDYFASIDGCNTCMCLENEEVACTRLFCVGCTYGGKTYKSGESFTHIDGCNTCNCNNGAIACTLMACTHVEGCKFGDDSYDVGEQFKYQCNDCFCSENGIIGCTTMMCPATYGVTTEVCNYEGKTYDKGHDWESSDGCNKCYCFDNGNVACTYRHCNAGSLKQAAWTSLILSLLVAMVLLK